MRSLNIQCLKTEQTFKNKHYTERVLKERHQCAAVFLQHKLPVFEMIFSCFNNAERNSVSVYDGDDYACNCVIDKGRTGSKSMLIACIIGAVISFILPSARAVEVEESITINKPVTGASSEPQPWVHFSTEYVRCFCNLPACVSTGYMCKSSGGGCYSDLLDHPAASSPRSPSTAYRGRHGCLELLTDKEQRSWCQNNPDSNTRLAHKRRNHPKSLLLCCYHDMCNHADSPETKTLIDNAILGGILNDSEHRSNENGIHQQETTGYTTADVWFKAATIAVPICGAVILFVLIVLAVRILRTETMASSSHKLGPSCYMHPVPSQNKSNCDKFPEHYDNDFHRELNIVKDDRCFFPGVHYREDTQRQIRVPLLLQNNSFESKNEANAKINLLNHHGDCGLDSRLMVASNSDKVVPSKCSETHFSNNVNIRELDCSENHDKIYVKENILM